MATKRLTRGKGYIVEVYRPIHPRRCRRAVRAYREDGWPDRANPSLTVAYHVEGAHTQSEAIAIALECGAGKSVTARKIAG